MSIHHDSEGYDCFCPACPDQDGGSARCPDCSCPCEDTTGTLTGLAAALADINARRTGFEQLAPALDAVADALLPPHHDSGDEALDRAGEERREALQALRN